MVGTVFRSCLFYIVKFIKVFLHNWNLIKKTYFKDIRKLSFFFSHLGFILVFWIDTNCLSFSVSLSDSVSVYLSGSWLFYQPLVNNLYFPFGDQIMFRVQSANGGAARRSTEWIVTRMSLKSSDRRSIESRRSLVELLRLSYHIAGGALWVPAGRI